MEKHLSHIYKLTDALLYFISTDKGLAEPSQGLKL